MHPVFTGEDPPDSFTKSLFLAGPTPRSADVQSWRPEAIRFLEQAGFDGVVFVPENRDGGLKPSYDSQAGWEHRMLDMADYILFWVPRDLEMMPAFTTNIEFGWWMDSGKVIFGAPSNSPKNDYLRYCARKFMIPQAETLLATIDEAIKFVGSGAERRGGERFVPFYIWQTPSFQSWYQALKQAGNRLEWARLEWVKRVGPRRQFVYAWALHAHIFVSAEGRYKTNETVISRPNISSVLLYRRMPEIMKSLVVLVQEFRSSGATPDGFIHELPSGSSSNLELSPSEIASEEVYEETGLWINSSRLAPHSSRQLAGTFSAHKASLFSAELTYEELDFLAGQAGVAHGANLADLTGERTYVEIKTLEEILRKNLVDWSVLGMILSILNTPA